MDMSWQATAADTPATYRAPLAEMAVWDPYDDGADAGQALAELDRRSMQLLGRLSLFTLAVAVAGVAVSVLVA